MSPLSLAASKIGVPQELLYIGRSVFYCRGKRGEGQKLPQILIVALEQVMQKQQVVFRFFLSFPVLSNVFCTVPKDFFGFFEVVFVGMQMMAGGKKNFLFTAVWIHPIINHLKGTFYSNYFNIKSL